MENNLQIPSGEGPTPSLLESPSGRTSSDLDDADDAPGILDVVDHRHRGQRKPRSLGPWMMLAGIMVAGLLGWAWWVGSFQPVGRSTMAAMPASVHVGDMPKQTGRIATAWPDEPSFVTGSHPLPDPQRAAKSDVARIESVEPQVLVGQPGMDTPSEVVHPSPDASLQPSSNRPRESGRPSAAVAVRETGSTSKRTAGRRMTDPDADVIEVLMSRAAPAGVSANRSGMGGTSASTTSQDVVLVQPTLPTEELLRRCSSLGGLEAQLCHARICEARGTHHTACSVEAVKARHP